ncbi:NAD(P)H-hydrate epimerase [Quillaja saponaria]|uniref:pyridoxal 5'-phosphate synthase n=1 Tax=Quillaja saponaria TaxID=32244 RepID=A0AAD7PKG9_QUISA|nr:NAD(P)H-hydrate epimerase [Quillaja saponaria]
MSLTKSIKIWKRSSLMGSYPISVFILLTDGFGKSLIPKPKNWGGYKLTPKLFEFWQGQKSRLHDRLRYSPHEINGQLVWKVERLAP